MIDHTVAPGTSHRRATPLRLLLAWVVTAASLFVAAIILPGFNVTSFSAALAAAAVISVLNTLLPPVVAAVPLPFALLTGFLAVLVLDAAMLMAAQAALGSDRIEVNSWIAALAASLLATAVSVMIGVALGTDNEEAMTLRTARRIGRRSPDHISSDVPGIVYLEIDGLALPVLRRAMRDGSAPNMARWYHERGYVLTGWETDLSSQTGASQAGILLGSNDDIPAFRWVEKERGVLMTCSAPGDCAELERRHAGSGLLRNGGASRGNLLSGEADEVILTVSRLEAERGANRGYRTFFANGMNATRTLVLYGAEVIREVVAARQAVRRGVLPRGHRGPPYPFIRAVMTVAVRDLIVNSVITDLMVGRPAVYATFSSYDEVAHHSGLERVDTMEALRRLDERFGRIERASREAARPYHIVVLSDHGQTQGATFLQRNGYSLEQLVERSVDGDVGGIAGGDEQNAMVGHALGEATGTTGRQEGKRSKSDVTDRDLVVLGSGNLGLIYLMNGPDRLTMEQMEELHPRLLHALRSHEHVGFVMVNSAAHGPVVLGRDGVRHLDGDVVEGTDPLEGFSATAGHHLRRTSGFAHAPDILVNSFYDPVTDEGCAFEELISFHGGMGGEQTHAFLLYPSDLPAPQGPVIGAAAVHEILAGWRTHLSGDAAPRPGDPVGAAGP